MLYTGAKDYGFFSRYMGQISFHYESVAFRYMYAVIQVTVIVTNTVNPYLAKINVSFYPYTTDRHQFSDFYRRF